MKNKRLIRWALFIICTMSIPLMATLFTDEMQWSLFDFLLMVGILAGIAITYEWLVQRSEKLTYKIAFGLGAIGGLLLFLVNGAVGIIGNEGQEANLPYGLVFLTVLAGTVISKLKPGGMAITLFTTAIVTMVVPVIALIIWPPSTISWSPGIIGVLMISGFFALLFFISGIFFRRAI